MLAEPVDDILHQGQQNFQIVTLFETEQLRWSPVTGQFAKLGSALNEGRTQWLDNGSGIQRILRRRLRLRRSGAN